ncbi:hypothetical protein A3I48_01055 [Candidatus Daviesbacteria bacterium RIFCSPLOWO2_02_FULL_36_7]|uniref:Uncharacterized protein n=1 Tax=Candidatus Daviesbacteria bacterium RIFCSPLOWO2_02_FULL_36_7 TaxID=1797792 RepID=A0A1F5MI84_9BACT|nr:MAG: hypothetical protein A3I48_01055 [Candidatus Daviesbacteria bacterium RIFCSPLOWO2_02_FULL_36_7]
MERSNKVYTTKYFLELGFSKSEAKTLSGNWSWQTPQSMQEVRQGVIWERDNREASAANWAVELKERR